MDANYIATLSLCAVAIVLLNVVVAWTKPDRQAPATPSQGRLEHHCEQSRGLDAVNERVAARGADGWELFILEWNGDFHYTACYKRAI